MAQDMAAYCMVEESSGCPVFRLVVSGLREAGMKSLEGQKFKRSGLVNPELP